MCDAENNAFLLSSPRESHRVEKVQKKSANGVTRCAYICCPHPFPIIPWDARCSAWEPDEGERNVVFRSAVVNTLAEVADFGEVYGVPFYYETAFTTFLISSQGTTRQFFISVSLTIPVLRQTDFFSSDLFTCATALRFRAGSPSRQIL